MEGIFNAKIFYYFSGDEILSVNGHSTNGLSHSEAIAIFKSIKSGKVTIHVARRGGGGGGGDKPSENILPSEDSNTKR